MNVIVTEIYASILNEVALQLGRRLIMDVVVKLCKYGHEKTPENMYKSGNCKECQKSYQLAYSQTPERKAAIKAYQQSPEGKESRRRFQQSPKGKEYQKTWRELNPRKSSAKT